MQVQKLREERHMSRAELSRRSGIDYTTLFKIEKGYVKPFPGWCKRLAQALGVDERELIDGDGGGSTLKNEGKKRPLQWKSLANVVRNPAISPAARLLYAILLTYANEDGTCWPGVNTLAAALGYKKRTAIKLLGELVQTGVITRKRRGKTLTNVYQLGEVHNSELYQDELVTGPYGPRERVSPRPPKAGRKKQISTK